MNPIRVVYFDVFCAKKLKKARSLMKNLAKDVFLKFAPECWSSVVQCYVDQIIDKNKQ